MRLAGAALVTAAGLLGGLGICAGLRERAALRQSLSGMLALMEFELGRFQTPLPALFTRLADQSDGPVRTLCVTVRDGLAALDRQSFAQLWAGALSALPAPERQMLLPLGQVLGRYGAEETCAGLARCRSAMERARDEAQASLRERGRVAVGVSAAGAAALAVLLL